MATADASSPPGQDHPDTPQLEHPFPKTAKVERDIRTGRHCVFVLHAHLVSVTKDRHPVHLAAPERMEQIVRQVYADFGAELPEFNGEPDHVHLLVNFPPTMTISRLVNSLKGVSSRRLRQEFQELRPPLLAGQAAVVRVLLRRLCGWCAHYRLAPVHRAAEPPVQAASRPAAFTTGLKAGALAAI